MRLTVLCTVLMLAGSVLPAQQRAKRIAPVDPGVRQTFERQPKVAVLAGVGHYPQRSGLGQLRYPARDVDALEAELTRQSYKVVSLKEQEATKGSLIQALHDAGELVDRGSGTVLFFFSGHGFTDRNDNYLATFEATSIDLAGSGLSVRAVEDLLKATGAPRQVMFIDACRNEPGKAVGARTFKQFTASAGMRVLFSTKLGRISYEDDQLQNGVFTHFLVRGLRGEAAGADGLITFRDLADFVTDGVSGYGFKHGQMQVPYEAGESSGDFLLARTTAVAPPVLPPVLPPAKADTLAQAKTLYDRKDYAAALPLFRRAAEAGSVEAMGWIGRSYLTGWGVPQDYAQAMVWYRKAADRGDAFGMNGVGFLYANGWGVNLDYDQAMQWYRKAAAAGSAVAMSNIGFAYEKGQGVPVDRQAAISWYRKALAAGHEGAKDSLRRLGVE